MKTTQKQIDAAKAKGFVPVTCENLSALTDKRLLFAAQDALGRIEICIGSMMVRRHPFISITVVHWYSVSPNGPMMQESYFLAQEAVNLVQRIDHPDYEFHIPRPYVFARP